MAELKPCPFCGGIPTMEYDDYFQGWIVVCENKKCRIRPMTDYHIKKGVVTREWNRRAEDGN